MVKTKAVGLFSGGLDSILAARVIAEQGIEVKLVKFVTPFFDYDLLTKADEYQQDVFARYGFEVELVDISEGYIDLLRKPAHGFGKNFNPCIDCKVMMLSKSRQIMVEWGGSFLFTGEVLGQRAMSQRRDALRIIERDSGCEDILVRPLCALRLQPTKPERDGVLRRDGLHGFTGRGRREQIKLAKSFGMVDFPNGAGGCILTDVNLASRIEAVYNNELPFLSSDNLTVTDIRLLLMGRHFSLPGGRWLVLGRNQRENEQLIELKGEDDIILFMPERPGPTGLLRFYSLGSFVAEEFRLESSLVVAYGRKIKGELLPGTVQVEYRGEKIAIKSSPALAVPYSF